MSVVETVTRRSCVFASLSEIPLRLIICNGESSLMVLLLMALIVGA